MTNAERALLLLLADMLLHPRSDEVVHLQRERLVGLLGQIR